MDKVLAFGTFDFFHIGHLHFLLEAKKQGDRLVVAIAQDKTVEMLKEKAPVHTLEERRRIIEHLDFVDEVVDADPEIGNFKILEVVKPDIVCVGYDQEQLDEYLNDHKFAYDLPYTVVRLEKYAGGERKSSQAR